MVLWTSKHIMVPAALVPVAEREHGDIGLGRRFRGAGCSHSLTEHVGVTLQILAPWSINDG